MANSAPCLSQVPDSTHTEYALCPSCHARFYAGAYDNDCDYLNARDVPLVPIAEAIARAEVELAAQAAAMDPRDLDGFLWRDARRGAV